MRWLVVCWLAGCEYHPDAAATGDGAPPDDATDAPGDSDHGGDGNSFVLCDQPGTDLRLCMNFDGDCKDRSGHNNNAVTSGGLLFAPGVHGMAVNSGGGDIAVPDNASLDVTQFTIRMKVFPTSVPMGAGSRYGLIENNAYRIFMLEGGVIRCAVNGVGPHEAITTVAIPTNAFTRVTCTYDGLLLKVYFDGVEKASVAAADTLKLVNTITPIAQSEPLNPSERLQGSMDELEVFGSIQPP